MDGLHPVASAFTCRNLSWESAQISVSADLVDLPQLIDVAGGIPMALGGFRCPGRLYFAGNRNDKFKIVAMFGRLLRLLGGGVDRPVGLAIQGQGLWLPDTCNHRFLDNRNSGGR